MWTGDSTRFGCDDFRDHDSRGSRFHWDDSAIWEDFKGYISKIESLIANQVGIVDFLGGLLGDLKDAVHRLRISTEESERERDRVCVTAFSSNCSDAHQRLNI